MLNTSKKTCLRGQPPCEAVSWNWSILHTSEPPSCVSLLVRLWVEMIPWYNRPWKCVVSLLVRLWVEMTSPTLRKNGDTRQPPCEAVSWNSLPVCKDAGAGRQPPCEAVSWNGTVWSWREIPDVSLLVRLWVEILKMENNKTLSLSASLWGCELKYYFVGHLQSLYRQPPCEAVSWNNITLWILPQWQRQPPCEAVSWNNNIINNFLPPTCVSLLVRLWVEIDWDSRKSPHIAVSLLVRLWVEIDPVSFQDLGTTSASLWGCELKCQYLGVSTPDARQPPCEAVSWNVRLLEHIPAS